MSTHSFIRETGPRPQEGGPPRSAIRGGGPLGLRRVPQGSLRQAAAGCSGRTRRLALDLCGANPLLRPLLVRRAAARHKGARSRRPVAIGTRSWCPRPPLRQARRHSRQRRGAPEIGQSEPPPPEPNIKKGLKTDRSHRKIDGRPTEASRGTSARRQMHNLEKLKNCEHPLRKKWGMTKWRELLMVGAVLLPECGHHGA